MSMFCVTSRLQSKMQEPRQILQSLAAMTNAHCPPPPGRGLEPSTAFQLYFQLGNPDKYKCRLVGDAIGGTWKLETVCGQEGEFDAIERYRITEFFTTMSFVESWFFTQLFEVSRLGTRQVRDHDVYSPEFAALECKVLGKVWEACAMCFMSTMRVAWIVAVVRVHNSKP